MKIVYTGLESSGKTLALAELALWLVRRNKAWEKRYGFHRKILTNLIFSPTFLAQAGDYIEVWRDSREIVLRKGVDIIYDEISNDFSALKKEPMPKRVNAWLRQGDKQGVDIYATAQEFHDIHLDFRRRVHHAYVMRKLIGSGRGGDNLPPIRLVWGIVLKYELKIRPYNELEPELESIIPDIIFITKSLCGVFDTHQIIPPAAYPELEHIERVCPVCGIKKIIHR